MDAYFRIVSIRCADTEEAGWSEMQPALHIRFCA